MAPASPDPGPLAWPLLALDNEGSGPGAAAEGLVGSLLQAHTASSPSPGRAQASTSPHPGLGGWRSHGEPGPRRQDNPSQSQHQGRNWPTPLWVCLESILLGVKCIEAEGTSEPGLCTDPADTEAATSSQLE